MEEIKRVVEVVKQQCVVKTIAGGGNGSIILFEIGEPVVYILYIYCTWRLEKGNEVLSGWNESPDPETGHLTLTINALEGDIIEEVSLSNFYDLSIHFKSSKRLTVFCDRTPNLEGDYTNWSFCDIHTNKCYTIDKNFSVQLDTYN
ncbi:hypothetical protein QNI19_38345 [Cytophagaceae bacterium DM2B3-1]|uniref:Uncharacterized protein n=1 Tax=Xanthocytophaga flava TaxID=3048013 RepID=A0ABT7CYM7_9BACT|nr:hypothetical protein [Xanthocytophaga flavus]MDJ1473810.1 hypothetical protein [Xanthocytophaga flavus]MDJ1498852.1 hypothetical protein [Xanthocytophaga flavus]